MIKGDSVEFVVGINIRDAEKNLNLLDVASKKTSRSIAGIQGPTKDAGASLFALTQVTRDLPFGFMAISNNLPILFDRFGELTKSSGGFLGALKALKVELIGAGGITFAISSAISLITYMTMSTQGAKKSINEFTLETILAKTESEKWADSIAKVRQELNRLTDDQLKIKIEQLGKQVNDLTSKALNKALIQQYGKEVFAVLSMLGLVNSAQQDLIEASRSGVVQNEALKIMNNQALLPDIQRQIEEVKGLRDKATTTKELTELNFKLYELEKKRHDLEQLGVPVKEKKKKIDKESLPFEHHMYSMLVDSLSLYNAKLSIAIRDGEVWLKQTDMQGQALMEGINKFMKPIDTSKIKKPELDLTIDKEQFIEDTEPILFDFITSFGQTLAGAGTDAFQAIFGEANSLLEKFIQNVFESLAIRGANALIGGLFSLIPGGGFVSSFLTGAGTFHSGGIVPGRGERGIKAKGGEMILTKDDQTNLMKVIREGRAGHDGVINNHIVLSVGNTTMRKSITENLSQADNRLTKLRIR